MADVNTAEKTDDFGKDDSGVVSRWLAEIKAYDKTFNGWMTRAGRVVRRYRNEVDDQQASTDETRSPPRRYNILWSNIQTLQPALYSRMPKANISRKHGDRDQVARAAAQILERATAEEIDEGGFDEAMRSSRDDHLLTARGQAWVRYVPTYGEETTDPIMLQSATESDDQNASESQGEDAGAGGEGGEGGEAGMPAAGGYTHPDTGEPVTDYLTNADGQAYINSEPYRPVVAECTEVDHISWKDFGHTPAPTWKKVRAVWKRELMTRDQLIERFGAEIGGKVALTKAAQNIDDDTLRLFGDVFKRGEVFEIWDKPSHKVYWISEGFKEKPLDVLEDPLKLRDFFPCPKPFFGTTTTDSLIPVTDYDEYAAQADEIDVLTRRIGLLTRALKVAGAYNGTIDSPLAKILDGDDNTLIPVDNWAVFAEKGGLPGAISFLPIKDISDTLVALSNIREQLKRDLYEISGLSDIVRGQGQASETATAQRIKGQFAGMRMQDRQSGMARFARDIVRIVAEVIAEHFSPETLWEVSGWGYTDEARTLDKAHEEWNTARLAALDQDVAPPQPGQPPARPPPPYAPSAREVFDAAVEMLRSDTIRGFRIDVETDTMVFEDQQAEKQARVEFVQAVSAFLKEAVPASIQFPAIAPILMDLMLFAIRGFRAGSDLEAMFEEAADSVAQMKGQPPQGQQQGPDPVAMAQAQLAQLKGEIEKARLELDRQVAAGNQSIAERRLQLDEAKAAGDQTAALAAASAQAKQQADGEGRAIDFSLKNRELGIREREVALQEKQAEVAAQKTLAETEATRAKTMIDTKPANDLADMVAGLTTLAEQIASVGSQMGGTSGEMQAMLQNFLRGAQAPKQVVRDEKGRIVGVQTVSQ